MSVALSPNSLGVLCQLAIEAGRAIMRVYETDFSHEFKDDDSPLTAADLAADRIITEGLTRSFPTIFVLSEEGSTQSNEERDQFFLVDPLDGTKEFIKRNGEFTVNIALIEHGVPVMGVVYAPAVDALYFASQGKGAYKQSGQAKPTQIHATPAEAGSVLRIVGSRSHQSEAMSEWLKSLDQPYEFVAVGSSLKFCRIAEGAADFYIRFGPTSQWDTAAGHAIALEAGLRVTDHQGQDLVYGLTRPILNPDFKVFKEPR